ncbi:MAG: glutamyl-tRNA reductase [Deltaproteobacteria bacterium]|nr:glutamyl-tRNA reductase [Deltaproteobacteria bacterium]
MNQEIFLIGLNHKTADVGIRERFALAGCDPADSGLIHDRGPISEVMILSTCNRVEFLAVGDQTTDIRGLVLNFWAKHCDQPRADLDEHTYCHQGDAAVDHLFTVASSLDSMILGEPQILGQLKTAYRASVEKGTARVIINRLLHKAFSVAKRVRTETAIASSAVSISYAAVELARKIFTDLSRHGALLVGAGEMAELAATHLLSAGVRDISVVNRTLAKGEELARQFGGHALPFEQLSQALLEADIVISSTGSPTAIIKARDMKDVLRKRRNRPIFFIDIAVPRDIDPDVNSLDNVYLYDIDDLKEVVEENLAGRQQEAAKAREIVAEEVTTFMRWRDGLALQPTIVALLGQGEDIARRELRRSIKQLGPNPDPQMVAVLERLAISICHKICHEPISYLKRRSQEEGSAQRFIHNARRMFNLDHEIIPEEAHLDRRSAAEPHTEDRHALFSDR